MDPELPKDGVDHKGAIVDVRVRLADGHQLDLEMQQISAPSLSGRIVYSWARILGGQLQPGEDHEQLARCTVVVFVTTAGPTARPRFHTVYRMLDVEDHTVFSDLFEVHWIELSKLALAKDEPQLARWARFFMAETDAEREALAEEDPVMQDAKQALDDLSADPKARQLAADREFARRMYEYTVRTERAEARKQGRQEGREEGRQEGREEGLRGAFLRSVEILSDQLGLAIDEDRHRRMIAASARDLEALLVHLHEHRAWPR